jgi:iron complex outermembrane receptor protein
MTNFARSLYATTSSHVAMGIALAVLGAVPAFAQDAPSAAEQAAQAEAQANAVDPGDNPQDPAVQAEESNEDIVVTGLRASLETSARIKRNTTTIVEVVTAEDIGKLPDVSIADSLSRLPGVTAQRLEGRDQRLSIRGLGPDFGVTLLNGREQVTVGDNRGVEYDQYPAEFFRNVIVNKTANASLVPAGISGTVDLRLLRPLDESNRIIAFTARGQHNSLPKLNPDGDRNGWRASAAYVDQFADDKVGLSLGISHTKLVGQNERYNSWGFPTATGAPVVPVTNPNGCFAFASPGSTDCALIVGGAKPFVQSNILKRTGVVSTLELRPNDRLHSTFDVLYSKFKEEQYLRGIEFPIAPAWGSNNTWSQPITVEDGLVTDITMGNVVGVVRNDYNKRTADNWSLGGNTVYALTDKLNVTLDTSWSHAKRTDFLLENYSGTGWNSSGAKDTIHITANDDGTFDIVPTIDYANPANLVITDPRGWGWNGTEAVVQAGFLNKPKFEDDLKALRASLDGEIESSFVNRWEVGGVYSRRSKDSKYTSFFLCPKDPNPSCTVASGTATSLPIPQEALIGTVALDYLGVPGMVAMDPLYLYDNVYDEAFDNRPGSLARDYNVTEKVLTGYAMLNIDTQLGSIPVVGSVGAQLVHTKQSSDGRIANFQSIDGVPTVTIADADGGTSYTDILPSLALSFHVQDTTFIKTGVSKTMIRPRMDQMRVSQEVSVDFTKWGSTDPGNSAFSSQGGNPELKPYQSLNFDLSVEHYLPKGGGYLAFATYYKKLTDFVDPNNATLYDFSALADALPDEVFDNLGQPGTTLGALRFPANTGDGHIFGQELTVSLPFVNFTQALDGFGFFGSAAHVKSKVKYANSPEAITVPGLSKWVGTASAYYEKNGIQARVSYRYRSKFLAEIAGLSANPEYRTAKSEGVLDAQIGYEFQEGKFKGLSITAQGKNLTNEPFITYEQGDSRLVRDSQTYGRDYYLSVGYKF